jgi:putative CocE/NonD family hydrolase
VTGGGGWRDLPEWPPPSVEHVRRLGPGGTLPSATADDSRHGGPHLGEGRALATFRYDPADPTPTVGGRLLTGAAGVRDNRALEARADVVAFTSEPVATDLEIVGTPYVELEHGTDNPHADVFVRLCDVDAKGRSRNFTDALVRLDPAHPAPTLRIPLDPCAHRLAAGHRLRLLVAGGSHPRFARNTGTGEPPAAATTLVPATHTVRGGRVVLPVTPA